MTKKLSRIVALMLAVIMSFSMLLVPVEAASFKDVSNKAWYKAAVDYVHERGWMAGISDTAFGPNMKVTRGMAVTVLARVANADTSGFVPGFSDTPVDAWYTNPAAWAASIGISVGVGNDNFGPKQTVTREQLVTFLYKLIQKQEYNIASDKNFTFVDMDSVSEYSKKAVNFCAGAGLISGFADGTFRPKESTTRAQLAAMMMKLDLLLHGEAVPAEPMPAQSFNGEAGADMSVMVNAPEGALPEDTNMTVSRVTDNAELNDIAAKVNGNVLAAADISFSKNEDEIEPMANVEVLISLANVDPSLTLNVIHLADNGSVEHVDYELVNQTRSINGPKAIRFYAKDFSIYAVTADMQVITAKFMKGETLIKEEKVLLNNGAVGSFYDPGVDLEDREVFLRWTIPAADPVVNGDIDAINAYVAANKDTLAGKTITVNAVTSKVLYLVYKDEEGKLVLKTDMAYVSDPTLEVDQDYVPSSGEYNFFGWSTTKGATVEEYENKDTITLTQTADGTTVLYPVVKKGYWLSFDSNKGSDKTPASFTETQFVVENENPAEPNDPTRKGYSFGGWFTTAECTTSFNFDAPLNADTKVYAQWNPDNHTPYYVIFWKQKATATGHDPETDYDFAGSEERTEAKTGDEVKIKTADTQQDYGPFFEYYADLTDTAEKTVNGDGSTVLNVHYNRVDITYTFTQPDGSTSSYGRYGKNNSGEYILLYDRNGNVLQNDNTRNAYYITYDWWGDPQLSSYTGTRYSAKTTSYTGLYEAPFEDWPENISWSCDKTTARFPLPLTTFDPANAAEDVTDTVLNFSYHSIVSGNSIKYYGQKIGGDWEYSESTKFAETKGSAGGTWYPTERFTGFTIYQYRYGNGSWVDTNYNDTIGINNSIDFRFKRNQHILTYISERNTENRVEKQETGIYYQQSLAEFGKDDNGNWVYVPTNGNDGYFFEGWYKDSACTQEFKFDEETMPDADVTVYAKWTQMRFRVVIDVNGGSFADPNQATSFKVTYGEAVSANGLDSAARPGYQLAGWYSDEELTNRYNFDQLVTDNTFGMDKEYREEETPEIRGKLTIYAKWRKLLLNDSYIQVIYDATANGTIQNSQTWKDPQHYADNAQAITQPAAKAKDAGYVFDKWVIKSSGKELNPNNTFDVLMTEGVEGTDDDGNTIYVITLEAKYKSSNSTHIIWVGNGGVDKDNKYYQESGDAQLNAFIDIKSPDTFTREDYVFVGWARLNEADVHVQFDNDQFVSCDHESTDANDNNMWLVYDHETEKYTVNHVTNGTTEDIVGVTQIAANNEIPTHIMYAVWRPAHFYVFHSGSGKLEAVNLPEAKKNNSGKFDLTSLVPNDMLYGGYYASFGGVNTEKVQALADAYKYKTSDAWSIGSATAEMNAVAYCTSSEMSFNKYDGNAMKIGSDRFWVRSNAYGYSKGDYNVAEPGNAMVPAADTVYYLKEVPETFLTTKYLYTYDALETSATYGKIMNFFMLTLVDDSYYAEVGFRNQVAPEPTEDGSKTGTYTKREVLAGKFILVQSNGNAEEDIPLLVDASSFGKKSGYVAVTPKSALVSENDVFSIMPVWKTYDGVEEFSHGALKITVGSDKKSISHDLIGHVQTPNTTMYINVTAAKADWIKDGAITRISYFRKDGDTVLATKWENANLVDPAKCIYACPIPSGEWTGFNVVRCNPDPDLTGWSAKWDQTNDIPFDRANNLVTITGNSGPNTNYNYTLGAY